MTDPARRRNHQVAVKLTAAEHAALAKAAAAAGQTPAAFLRAAFLRDSPVPLKTCALDGCDVKFYRGENGSPEALYCSLRHERTAAQRRWRQRRKEKAGQ